MQFSRLFLGLIVSFLFASPSSATGSTYLNIQSPGKGSEFVNGVANPVTWKKGLLDGINAMDIELSRLSTDGLIMVAANVPSTSGKLNLFLQDVPPGDDYYMLFLNSTHGAMYGTSKRFSVLPSGTTPQNNSMPAAVAGAPTVTVSGGPAPTMLFAYTFPAIANGALGFRIPQGAEASILGGSMFVASLACMLGAVWTVL